MELATVQKCSNPSMESAPKKSDGKDASTNEVLCEQEGYYYEAYSELMVHEGMLKDTARTLAYKRAILMNKHLIKDKIVLDIGCGTGILSLFAASAGAKTVIGIDCTDIARYAKEIAAANNLHNVHIIQSKVEEIQELPFNITEVDVIVSEWMGVCLFHESMLSTVIYARDKWLKKDGILMPDRVTLFLAGVEHAAMRKLLIDDWSSVYGFDMSALKELAITDAKTESIDESQVVTEWIKIREVDLYKTTADYAFQMDFTLKAIRSNYVNAFVTYFDAEFSRCHKPIILSTSPSSLYTHWRQTVLYLHHALQVKEGEEITGTFSLAKYKHNFRDLSIKLEVSFYGDLCKEHFEQNYVLR